MVKVLLIGGSSLLGRYLTITRPEHIDMSATYFMNMLFAPSDVSVYGLDVRDTAMMSLLFGRINPHVVIYAAAVGSVDYCEKHYKEAHEINVESVEYAVHLCNEIGATFVFISSNAVYDGENPPYAEGHSRRAVNRYGAMKIQAEDYIMRNSKDCVIIRPILLYGKPYAGGRANWATMIVNRLRKNLTTSIVTDTVTQPTYAFDVARAIWTILEHDDRRVEIEYNIADDKYHGSLYNFAISVAKEFDLDAGLLVPVESTHFKGLAPRPIDTTFDTSQLLTTGFRFSPDGLHSLRGELA